jgi:hypothetical protein
MLLAVMFLCQLAMLGLAAWLVGRRRRSTLRETSLLRASNWFIGIGVLIVMNALVLGIIVLMQLATPGR